METKQSPPPLEVDVVEQGRSKPLLARPVRAFVDAIETARLAKADASSGDGIRTLPRPKMGFYGFSFILCVIIPILASIVYFAWIAADQFSVEFRFAIRTALSEKLNNPLAEAAKSGLGGSGNNKNSGSIPQLADQDAYVVAHYLRSRGAITEISKTLDLPAMFQRSDADFWARLKSKPSAEEFEEYWRTMVKTAVDGPSGIVSVTIRAFRPEDARQIAQAMVHASEKLVNEMSARARADAVRNSEAEVRRSEKQVREALAALRSFRDQQGMIDPQSAANSTAKLLIAAMADRIKLQNELNFVTQVTSANAPAITALRTRLEAVDDQIVKLRSEMTSRNGEAKTVSTAIVKFEELELQRIFAEKMLLIAQSALERARIKAEQKQLYVSVFVPPLMPEEARYPERIAMPLIIAIVLLVLWGILALTVATVEDHLN